LHNLSWCAESALYAPILDESILERVQAPGVGERACKPSIVRIFFPIALLAAIRQDFTGFPSRSTVQTPQ